MNFNYPEMYRDIKLSLFSGDLGALYSLSCTLACLGALLSILWWYNKYMNDPFPRLDVRSVVRAGAVLFLTCNFHTFVLLPLDNITYYVTKGITAYVDSDPAGLSGTLSEAMKEVETLSKGGSLSGSLQSELSGALSGEEVGGEGLDGDLSLRGESSSLMESLTDSRVAGGGDSEAKVPWLRRMWEGVKLALSMKLGEGVENTATVLSWILSLLVKVVRYLVVAVSGVYLIILGFLGPFVFALSMLPGFSRGAWDWVAKYIQISFWTPVTAMVDLVNYRLKDALIAEFWKASFGAKIAFPLHILILDLVLLICLLAVPTISSWVVNSSVSSDIRSSVESSARRLASVGSGGAGGGGA